MALVNHTCSESTLPLTLSLSNSETKLFVRSRASAARPIRFLFSDFLFSDNAAPATNGRQALSF